MEKASVPPPVRLETYIPRDQIAALAKEAHASGQQITEVLRRKIAQIFGVSEHAITPPVLEPRPNIITDAAVKYAQLVRKPNQGNLSGLPTVPGTFNVRLHE